jgi:hypothetical protein
MGSERNHALRQQVDRAQPEDNFRLVADHKRAHAGDIRAALATPA